MGQTFCKSLEFFAIRNRILSRILVNTLSVFTEYLIYVFCFVRGISRGRTVMAERYRIAADIDSVGIADKNQFFKTDLPDFVFTCWTAGEDNVADDFTVAVEKRTGVFGADEIFSGAVV